VQSLRPSSAFLVLAATAATSSLAHAQWVTYSNETATRVSAAPGLVVSDQEEKDYAWADLDHDGDTDLVVARKEPFTSSGHFPNVLLMNEGGVLTDRSGTLTTSTVPGSSGFLDATNDRDVVIADINGDGWEDVIFATTLTANMPQYIRANRVYLNLGEQNGVWQGLLYDDPARIDDTPWNGEHRFCSVAAGDVDGDGDIDLYFGDYQQGGTRSMDIDDRLLINDGTGYFTDESAARMSTTMLESSFGMKVAIVDMNNDGKLDIMKDDALNAPQAVSISYNDTATEGVFGSYDLPYGNAPYHFNVGDLNNDGWTDFIVSDDGQDQYMLNQGPITQGGPTTFAPSIAFSYTGGGGDDGFGGNNLIADLDGDGWQDAIVADADVDIPGCNRRCHIFRNLGNAPNVTLQEQIVNGQVVGGITPAALQGTFDVAVFDINGDGAMDLVVGRCTGTEIYINDPPTSISFSFVGGQPAMVDPGVPTDITVDVVGLGVQPVSGTGELHYAIGAAPFQSVAMTDNGAGQYTGTLPLLNCTETVRYYVSVQATDSQTYSDPPSAPSGYYEALSAYGTGTLYQNDFEANATGWTVVNDPALINGAWERVDPNGTVYNGQLAAPFGDAQSGAADQCFVTKQGALVEPAGLNDVDGGPTDLISPVLDYANSDGNISFQAWLYSSVNGSDPLQVDVTNDGSTWVPVMQIQPEYGTPDATNQWTQYSFKLSDYVTPSATVQVRFRIADLFAGQVVEAAIDVFRAGLIDCRYCQPDFALQTSGPATLSMCGDVLSAATPDTTLEIESLPAGTNGLLIFDAIPNPSPWNGGELISPAPLVLSQFFANGNGGFAVPLAIGGLLPPGFALYVQAVYSDASLPGGAGVTNALRVDWN
jgi:hypothetical protein